MWKAFPGHDVIMFSSNQTLQQTQFNTNYSDPDHIRYGMIYVVDIVMCKYIHLSHLPGRSFHWGLVHLVQSASLRWNSPKISHTVFDTACRCQVITNIQYWLQIIDIHHLCDESNPINPRCGKISANFYISPPHPPHPQFYPQKMVEI